MSSMTEWEVPQSVRPKRGDYAYDLDAALMAAVSLRTVIPPAAFTADILGTERLGSGVLIRDDGLILTVGYLVTEAEEVWITLSDGRVVPGHVIGFDHVTGLGLVQALARLDLPHLPLGCSAHAEPGMRAVLAGGGGLSQSVAARVIARQEFAGYWEYVIDDALFTSPAHPHWGGTGLIGPGGDLIGIGSLQLEGVSGGGRAPLNMVVPIDLLPPILDDMLTGGKPNRPPRPWLGLYADDPEDQVVLLGVADGGPADRAGLTSGDLVLAVDGSPVSELAHFFKEIWALGEAGVEVPLTIWRDGDTFDVGVNSGDRTRFLKRPQMH